MRKWLITLLAMLLLALPAHAEWDEHILLEDKGWGGCTVLTGDVRLVVVLVDVQGQEWDALRKLQMMQQVQQAALALEEDAAAWGVTLNLIPEWHEAAVAASVAMDDTDESWADAVLASVEGLHGRTDAGYAETPIVFCLSSVGRAFAHTEWFRGEAEFAFLFTGDDEATLRHELLHLYGAQDLYVQADVLAAAQALCPDSIMLDSLAENRVDALTAYLIGWTQQPDAVASDILRQTSHVTPALLDAAREANVRTGYGVVTGTSGVYSGMLVDGVAHGWGEFRWHNGDVYLGDWVWGERTGYGAYTWAVGGQYTGDFVRGDFTGHGTYTWPDGSSYTGDFLDGQRTGYGVMTWPDGTVYAGGFQQGSFHGLGVLTRPDGSTYAGDFVMDACTGQGTYTWPDGSTYAGDFVTDARTGQGTYTWPDGSTYTGGFYCNLFHGEGAYRDAEGNVTQGTWEYGELVSVSE